MKPLWEEIEYILRHPLDTSLLVLQEENVYTLRNYPYIQVTRFFQHMHIKILSTPPIEDQLNVAWEYCDRLVHRHTSKIHPTVWNVVFMGKDFFVVADEKEYDIYAPKTRSGQHWIVTPISPTELSVSFVWGDGIP